MNDELVITMAAAKTEAPAGAEKLVTTTSRQQTEHTQESTLSSNGNGGSNCDGDVDDDMAT